jgi:beta-lactamase regulating signal transducer with metallopeptidase domain
MKKILLIVCSLFVFSPSVIAASIINSTPCPADSSVCNDINNTSGTDNSELFGPGGVVTKVTTVLSIAAGVISIFIMIYAGLAYVLSGGDSKKTATAKNTIIYGAIGLVIAMIAGAIVSFVLVKI